MNLTFSLQGSLITNMAHEKLFQEHDLKAAISLLTNSLQTDQLTPNEITMLALQILNGDADITGTYPEADYGVEFHENTDENNCSLENITNVIAQINDKLDTMKNNYDELLKQYLFICSELSPAELDDINARYYQEHESSLFPDTAAPDCHEFNGANIKSFLNQKIREKDFECDNDYGWLSPDGTYYPVEWSMHEKWATDYLNENYPFRDNPSIYWKTNPDGSKQSISGGDVLIHSLHWVLIDNPYQGEGNPHYDIAYGLTKHQKEFLYDYFISQDRHADANALYDE